MKNNVLITISFICSALGGCALHSMETADGGKIKPTQHLVASDVTSMEEAEGIFVEKTAELRRKTLLDVMELHEIHIITYTLEKSVAYLVANLTGEGQQLASNIAIVVEDIHIYSERNLKGNTQSHLSLYFDLADRLIATF